MEPMHTSAAGDRAPLPPGTPELVICNGRMKGTRRPLDQPFLLIGRAEGCDLRLNVKEVSPLHCGLVNGFAGLSLRCFQNAAPTQVNGQPETDCPLKNGDILSIGPFRFQIRWTGRTPAQQL